MLLFLIDIFYILINNKMDTLLTKILIYVVVFEVIYLFIYYNW